MKPEDPLATPGPEEQQEADTLAQALEGKDIESSAPADALETAALIRHAASGAELMPERQEAVFQRVLQSLPEAGRPRPHRPFLRYLAPVGGLAAACTVLLLVLLRSSPRPAVLPAPDSALLSAQADAATGDSGLSSLQAHMSGYRSRMLSVLAVRYGGER